MSEELTWIFLITFLDSDGSKIDSDACKIDSDTSKIEGFNNSNSERSFTADLKSEEVKNFDSSNKQFRMAIAVSFRADILNLLSW